MEEEKKTTHTLDTHRSNRREEQRWRRGESAVNPKKRNVLLSSVSPSLPHFPPFSHFIPAFLFLSLSSSSCFFSFSASCSLSMIPPYSYFLSSSLLLSLSLFPCFTICPPSLPLPLFSLPLFTFPPLSSPFFFFTFSHHSSLFPLPPLLLTVGGLYCPGLGSRWEQLLCLLANRSNSAEAFLERPAPQKPTGNDPPAADQRFLTPLPLLLRPSKFV